MTRVKICGITTRDDAQVAVEAGADMIGLIFYPPSPRYVTPEQAHSIVAHLPSGCSAVGVFVNENLDTVTRIAQMSGVHMVQLHGDETPKYCERMADYVSVIKAFRLSENDNIEWMIKPYMESCDMFMFDTMGAGYGGTGKKFDWSILKDMEIGKPFLLSGGIEPGDEERLMAFSSEPVARALFAVDINSKFEISPGLKDMDKVLKFVQNMNGHNAV